MANFIMFLFYMDSEGAIRGTMEKVDDNNSSVLEVMEMEVRRIKRYAEETNKPTIPDNAKFLVGWGDQKWCEKSTEFLNTPAGAPHLVVMDVEVANKFEITESPSKQACICLMYMIAFKIAEEVMTELH